MRVWAVWLMGGRGRDVGRLVGTVAVDVERLEGIEVLGKQVNSEDVVLGDVTVAVLVVNYDGVSLV